MRAIHRKALLATGVIVASAVANAAPAQAGEAVATQTLVYNKGDGPTNGRVIWTQGLKKSVWRAGSGNGPNWSNACVRNEGHLPNGKYRIRAWHNNYRGSVIFGRAVQLEDKQCVTGVWRTELFIHSEQTVNNTQGSTERTRWDGDQDYKSQGCVKMHPNDIAALYKTSAANGPRPTVLSVVS
jgi:hypothetical protein